LWDSHDAQDLVCNGMSKTPPNLTNLPPEVQAYVAAQTAELSELKQAFLGSSLDHATVQKRLKDEMASVDAALSAERTAHARAIQNRDTIIADLRLQLHGHKKLYSVNHLVRQRQPLWPVYEPLWCCLFSGVLVCNLLWLILDRCCRWRVCVGFLVVAGRAPAETLRIHL
jgi:hypothetical protein